ncbi:MAG TPA: response regulator transcription factor [Bacillota bacterium]|nr:response regulator transcription factor [Bacillota bacterium]
MKPLIYSVEDDINIQNVIQIALNNSNFDIKTFSNAQDLFVALNKQTPDLFLLDIMLPDVNGIEILKKIRENPKHALIPVMIISAKISEIDRVIGLDSGADDYMIKPFGVLELVSRVKALLRRTKSQEINESFSIGDLVINQNKHICQYQGKEITLTRKQFELLFLLMQKHNEILSRDDILNSVWGYEYIGETRTLDVHVKEIRKRLREAGISETAIETIRGIGYRFVL